MQKLHAGPSVELVQIVEKLGILSKDLDVRNIVPLL